MVPTAAAEALQFAPMPGFWFWLIVAGALVVVEILTLAFFAAFIAAAAVGAALAALLGFNPLVQAIVLLVLGVGGIGAARPLLMQALARRREPVLRIPDTSRSRASSGPQSPQMAARCPRTPPSSSLRSRAQP